MRKTALALTLALALAVSFSADALFGVSVANFHVPPTPVIELQSPTSFVNLPDVPLVVRAKVTTIGSGAGWEGIRWLNYSVDGKPAIPLTLELQGEIHTLVNDTTNPFNGDPYNLYVARTVLSGLSDGQHHVSIDGQSVFNKTLHLAELFTVDTVHPKIKVLSPLRDNTYLSTNLMLEYQVDEWISWAGYKLDGGDFVTSRINTTLTNLSYRTHVIQVYANDSAGNLCYSPTIVFIVKDVDPPTIIVLSAASTYNATEVPLNFAVNENVSWICYSLDDQANVTMAGNTTLTGLPSGSHTLRVFANDTAGNVGVSQAFAFAVASSEPQQPVFPTIVVAAALASIVAVVGGGLLVYYKRANAQQTQSHNNSYARFK